MKVRPADAEDLPRITALTRQKRRALAEWAPVYFNRREGADEIHAAFLRFLVGSADHDTRVFFENDEVMGFFHLVAQAAHHWVDDLCVDDPARWDRVVETLVPSIASVPWVTCVARADLELGRALEKHGLKVTSSYWSRQIGESDDATAQAARPEQVGARAPRHTFSRTALDPAAPGALLVGDSTGYVVGSPSMEPPIYDAGGPVCIIDRVVGTDRPRLLQTAMSAVARRGDIGAVVVCDTRDHDLDKALRADRFEPQVDLFCCD